MDLTFITEYISPISLIICLAVGYIIKALTSNAAVHKLIPCIVAIIGIVICCWDAGAFNPTTIAAGLISGLASTGLYEALKNILNIHDDGTEIIVDDYYEE